MRKLLLIAALLAAPPAQAGPLSDLLMAPGLFAGAPEGKLMEYSHMREAPPPVGDLGEGRLVVSVIPGVHGPMLDLQREEGGETLLVSQFAGSGPNPVLIYFLESTARAMAEATGGSPFYIRNRIRSAMAEASLGSQATPELATLHPFVQDPNRGRMGAFGDLAIALRFDPQRPERILELSADTPPGEEGYHDRLVLVMED
jgi:hypothetical protein